MAMSQKKREQRNRTILAAVTAFIMISSVLGVLNYNHSNTSGSSLPYGNYNFKQVQDEQLGQVWETSVNGISFRFHFHPFQLEQLPAQVDWSSLVHAEGYLLTSPSPSTYRDPSFHDAIAGAEYLLAQTIQTLGKPTAFGFLNATGYQIPTITCANATMNIPVIVFSFSNTTALTQEGYCYQIQAATNQELFMMKDLLAYHILGIMNATPSQGNATS